MHISWWWSQEIIPGDAPPSSKFIDGNIESYNNYVMVTTLWIQIVPEKILNPPNHTPVPFPKEVWLEG